MQGLANKTKDGDCGLLASKMNHFPWLNTNREMFTVNEELWDQCAISVFTTLKAFESVKVNKAAGPENIPAWVLRNHANVLAPPLTAILTIH